MPEFAWLPANQATADDVDAVFATGGARKYRCQALKVPGWIWRDTTQEERDAALLEQPACGTPGPTSGLIGYVDGEAAGWVAVEPPPGKSVIWDEASVGLVQVSSRPATRWWPPPPCGGAWCGDDWVTPHHRDNLTRRWQRQPVRSPHI